MPSIQNAQQPSLVNFVPYWSPAKVETPIIKGCVPFYSKISGPSRKCHKNSDQHRPTNIETMPCTALRPCKASTLKFRPNHETDPSHSGRLLLDSGQCGQARVSLIGLSVFAQTRLSLNCHKVAKCMISWSSCSSHTPRFPQPAPPPLIQSKNVGTPQTLLMTKSVHDYQKSTFCGSARSRQDLFITPCPEESAINCVR